MAGEMCNGALLDSLFDLHCGRFFFRGFNLHLTAEEIFDQAAFAMNVREIVDTHGQTLIILS